MNFPLAGGGTATLALHNGAAQRAPGGGRVVLGIRPEHLSRYNQDVHNAGRASRPSPRRSKSSSRPAPRPWRCCASRDREVVGRFAPDEAPKMGEQMTLAVDMTRACLFDPTTQRLI